MITLKRFFKKYNGARTTGPDKANPLMTMATAQLISFRNIYAEMEAEAIQGKIERSPERSRAFVQICEELKRRSIKGESLYQDYLDTWDDQYGDSDYGDFTYYHYGQQRTKRLPKMTEAQFTHAQAEFDRLSAIIFKLQRRRPDYGDNDELDKMIELMRC